MTLSMRFASWPNALDDHPFLTAPLSGRQWNRIPVNENYDVLRFIPSISELSINLD